MENINKPPCRGFKWHLSLIKDSVVVKKRKNKRKEGGMIEGRKGEGGKRELETELAWHLESDLIESQLYDLNWLPFPAEMVLHVETLCASVALNNPLWWSKAVKWAECITVSTLPAPGPHLSLPGEALSSKVAVGSMDPVMSRSLPVHAFTVRVCLVSDMMGANRIFHLGLHSFTHLVNMCTWNLGGWDENEKHIISSSRGPEETGAFKLSPVKLCSYLHRRKNRAGDLFWSCSDPAWGQNLSPEKSKAPPSRVQSHLHIKA